MINIAHLSRHDQISYWVGAICIAIGTGEVRSTVSQMIDYYQNDAYTRGVAAGKTNEHE
jgi:dipeptide/tripeptide permease